MHKLKEFFENAIYLPVSENPVFEQKESLVFHSKFEFEKQLYSAVVNGDVSAVEQFFTQSDNKVVVGGTLSKDKVRNAKYTAICLCTLVTRCAILGGVPELDAYNLSDQFIQKVDNCDDADVIIEEMYQLVVLLAKMVRDNKNGQVQNLTIATCQRYIAEHIHYRITLDEVAEACGYSPSYLSKLFKKELGLGFSDYILSAKIKEAKHLIKTTSLKDAEIGSFLAFSSQSHFITTFKRFEYTTPGAYRISIISK